MAIEIPRGILVGGRVMAEVGKQGKEWTSWAGLFCPQDGREIWLVKGLPEHLHFMRPLGDGILMGGQVSGNGWLGRVSLEDGHLEWSLSFQKTWFEVAGVDSKGVWTVQLLVENGKKKRFVVCNDARDGRQVGEPILLEGPAGGEEWGSICPRAGGGFYVSVGYCDPRTGRKDRGASLRRYALGDPKPIWDRPLSGWFLESVQGGVLVRDTMGGEDPSVITFFDDEQGRRVWGLRREDLPETFYHLHVAGGHALLWGSKQGWVREEDVVKEVGKGRMWARAVDIKTGKTLYRADDLSGCRIYPQPETAFLLIGWEEGPEFRMGPKSPPKRRLMLGRSRWPDSEGE